jgi:hypothetical protein
MKTNVRFSFPFPFAENKRKFAVSVYGLQKTNGSFHFQLVPFTVCGIPEMWRHGLGDMVTWRWSHGNMEIWKHGDIKRWRYGDMKFVLCPFVDEKQSEVIPLQTD